MTRYFAVPASSVYTHRYAIGWVVVGPHGIVWHGSGRDADGRGNPAARVAREMVARMNKGVQS